MRKNFGKNNLGKIFFHPIFISFIGFGVLLYVTIPVIYNMQKQKRINDEIEALQKEIARLDGNNVDLKKMINYLNSDQFVLEQARLNLNYKKSKEEVVVIKNLGSSSVENINNKVFDINNGGKSDNVFKNTNIYKWWRFFVKI